MSNTIALLFAIGAMLLWSVGDFLIQRMTKKIDYFKSLIFVNLIGGIILLPFALKSFSELTINNILPLIILGIFDIAYGLTILKAYEEGKVSVIEVIMTIELPLTVMFGLLFLHESLSWLQTVLILIVLSGIFFVSHESKTFYQKIVAFLLRRKSGLEKGALIALVAALFSAFYNFFIAYNVQDVSPFMTIWLPWVFSLLVLLIYFYFRHGLRPGFKILAADAGKYKKLILLGSVFDAVAWVLYASAINREGLAIVTAITESYPALVLFYGVKFNKEKVSKFQYIGAALALAGSLAIALIS